MPALSWTPTWVMIWQLFLNNPSFDKWQRGRVKKSKLSAKQKYKPKNRTNPFSHCGKNLTKSEIQACSRRMRQIFVFVIRNVFPCGFHSVSETKKQQIIWEIARNFSQFEAAFVEVQSIFLQFCRRFNFTIWHMLSEKHVCSFLQLWFVNVGNFRIALKPVEIDSQRFGKSLVVSTCPGKAVEGSKQ